MEDQIKQSNTSSRVEILSILKISLNVIRIISYR